MLIAILIICFESVGKLLYEGFGPLNGQPTTEQLV